MSIGFRSCATVASSACSPAETSYANSSDTDMAGTRTLTIIKPDAFGSGKAGKILAHLEAGGFRIVAARVTHLTEPEAGAFYEVHRDRPFYRSLVTFMTSAACMPMVL